MLANKITLQIVEQVGEQWCVSIDNGSTIERFYAKEIEFGFREYLLTCARCQQHFTATRRATKYCPPCYVNYRADPAKRKRALGERYHARWKGGETLQQIGETEKRSSTTIRQKISYYERCVRREEYERTQD